MIVCEGGTPAAMFVRRHRPPGGAPKITIFMSSEFVSASTSAAANRRSNESVTASQRLAEFERIAPAFGTLVLRLSLGVIFVAHGFLKLLVFTLPGTAQFFAAHGFPGWSAYPVFAMELLGGLLLILGVRTRAVAIALIPVMAGAFLVHWPNGWMFTAPNGGWEYVAFIIAALISQAALGAGALAVSRPRI